LQKTKGAVVSELDMGGEGSEHLCINRAMKGRGKGKNAAATAKNVFAKIEERPNSSRDRSWKKVRKATRRWGEIGIKSER